MAQEHAADRIIHAGDDDAGLLDGVEDRLVDLEGIIALAVLDVEVAVFTAVAVHEVRPVLDIDPETHLGTVGILVVDDHLRADDAVGERGGIQIFPIVPVADDDVVELEELVDILFAALLGRIREADAHDRVVMAADDDTGAEKHLHHFGVYLQRVGTAAGRDVEVLVIRTVGIHDARPAFHVVLEGHLGTGRRILIIDGEDRTDGALGEVAVIHVLVGFPVAGRDIVEVEDIIAFHLGIGHLRRRVGGRDNPAPADGCDAALGNPVGDRRNVAVPGCIRIHRVVPVFEYGEISAGGSRCRPVGTCVDGRVRFRSEIANEFAVEGLGACRCCSIRRCLGDVEGLRIEGVDRLGREVQDEIRSVVAVGVLDGRIQHFQLVGGTRLQFNGDEQVFRDHIKAVVLVLAVQTDGRIRGQLDILVIGNDDFRQELDVRGIGRRDRGDYFRSLGFDDRLLVAIAVAVAIVLFFFLGTRGYRQRHSDDQIKFSHIVM